MLYIKMYQWIMSTDLSPNEKIVLALLRSMYEKDGNKATYSVIGSKREMARFLNMSNRTLDLYLSNLVKKKYLESFASNKTKTIFIFVESETDRIIRELRNKWRKF